MISHCDMVCRSLLSTKEHRHQSSYVSDLSDLLLMIVMFVAALVLILMLIAIVFVLLAHWRRHKRRLACRQQRMCANNMDGTFDPCVVDDAATDKLSCSGQALENGLCTSSGSASPRRPTSPKRPVSYTLSTFNSVMTAPGPNVDHLMRTHNYGSNANELENAGRQPDSSRNPEFVGRSPAITPKRSVAPKAVDNGEASKGLNNLNKAENYRKKSKYLLVIVC